VPEVFCLPASAYAYAYYCAYIVEAKNDDLTRGFTQLAVELIAISQVEEGDVFYGCVTIGDAWRFGILEKTNQQIFQDISLYRIPDDLEYLMRILVGILA
ncbi:MAG: hypothetical protein ACKPE1_24415, partial [Dolichospermum sp.]